MEESINLAQTQMLFFLQRVMRFCLIGVLLVTGKPSIGQIPNSSFEVWSQENGYVTPAGWDNLNRLTFSSGIFTCIKDTPGVPGNNFMILMSKTVPGKGVVPGVAVSGKLDTNTYKPISGFPYTNRPQYLHYNVQYMPYDPSDSSSVKVLLSKWNGITSSRDTVAYGASYHNAMAHTWFFWKVYLKYLTSDVPDSALIILSSSSVKPKEGSYIFLDSLEFSGSVIEINEPTMVQEKIRVFPNPATNLFTLEWDNNKDAAEVCVSDMLGREFFCKPFSHRITVNTTTWKKGTYCLKISKGNYINVFRKIIIY